VAIEKRHIQQIW